MNNQGAPSRGAPQRVVDPQEEELLGDTHVVPPLNDVRQRQDPSLHARPLVSPVGSANVAPNASMLKDCHDIVEDMVAKKLKQMTID